MVTLFGWIRARRLEFGEWRYWQRIKRDWRSG